MSPYSLNRGATFSQNRRQKSYIILYTLEAMDHIPLATPTV